MTDAYSRHFRGYLAEAVVATQQQSSEQEIILNPSPFTLADESYLIETLTECRVKLESALRTAHSYHQLPDLAEAIADSLTAIHKASAITIDPITYVE